MNTRIPLIAGNWKMHKTCNQAVETAKNLVTKISGVTGREIMIAPPFTALLPVFEVIKDTPVKLGAQNMFWEDEGAYTGEISGPMIKSAGCTYVIIGHSERRQYFGETDETVNKRLHAALSHGITPVICVGETEEERESGKTFSVLDKQLPKGLEGLSTKQAQDLVIAYEPVWAIGTGKTATPDLAQEVHKYIRKQLEDKFGQNTASMIRILYGGSVKPGNIALLMAKPDIDGALVGGASLDAETFAKIVAYE